MTSSSKIQKNYDLIEKCRQESQFKRLEREFLPQILKNNDDFDQILGNFLIGECFLENFLLENGAKPDNLNKELLKKAKKNFQSVLESNLNFEKFKFSNLNIEINFLLAKIHFLCAQYEECLNSISKNKLDVEKDHQEIKSLRTLRLIAESYALKALCYESTSSSKFQKKTRNDQILIFYEKCVELTVKFLENFDAYLTGGASQISTVVGQPQPSSAAQNSLTPAAASTTPSVNNPASPTSANNVNYSRPLTSDQFLGPFLQTALHKVPLEYLKRQEIAKAVDFYRRLILHFDRPFLQNLHQLFCRLLAQVLMRNVGRKFYAAPFSRSDDPQKMVEAENPSILVEKCNFSRSQNANFSPQTFSRPEHRLEEVFLLLQISDAWACKEAVLSRAEEHKRARDESLKGVKCAQNLSTLALTLLRQFATLSSAVFERSLKLAYEDRFVWLQFSLALVEQRRYARALVTLKQCSAIEPTDDDVLEPGRELEFLLAAKLCVEELGFFDQGLEMCQKVLTATSRTPDASFLARAHLLAGSALSLKAQCCPVYQEKGHLNLAALEHYRAACRLDPRDPGADFLLALQLACSGRLDEAAERCRESLRKRPEQPAAVLLMALLLTARNQYGRALNLVEEALEDFPTNYGLLVLRLKLEMKLEKAGLALITAKDLLIFWRIETFSPRPDRVVPGPDGSWPQNSADREGTNLRDDPESSSQHRTSSTAPAGAVSADGPSGSSVVVDAAATDKESLFGSAFARALTEYGGAVSTVSDSLGLTASNVYKDLFTQYRMQSNVWLELAELFLTAPDDQYVQEVQDCVDEACSQFPCSHQVLYLKGRLHEKAGRWQQAKSCYNASLALFPSHLPSWRRLAQVYDSCARHKIDDPQARSCRSADERMAERSWRRLIQSEPRDHSAWRSLGRLLARRRDYGQAARCLRTAVALEQTTPLMPFWVVPRQIHL